MKAFAMPIDYMSRMPAPEAVNASRHLALDEGVIERACFNSASWMATNKGPGMPVYV
jgi:hypothetical protein